MKKAIPILLIAVLILSFSSAVYAKTPSDKLSRGVANVFSGFLEVPRTMGEEWKISKNAAVGLFAGFFKGIVLGVVRTGSGLWDVLTFPIAVPKDYEPLYKPDYVFDKK